MGQKYYSPSVRGWFDEEAHGDQIPEDAVEVSDEQYLQLRDAASVGKVVVPGEGGFPVMADPPVNLEKIRDAIKAVRDYRRFHGGVQVGGMWFRSDQVAAGEYTALTLLGAGQPANTVLRANWRTMAEGVVVDMTPALVGQIIAAGFSAAAAIDDAAQAHLAALAVSEDPANYDYTTGWPPIFGEPVV